MNVITKYFYTKNIIICLIYEKFQMRIEGVLFFFTFVNCYSNLLEVNSY